MGLFDSVVSAAGGYKKLDALLRETIFDGYQEFQHSSDWAALFRYPDDLIIKRCYEIVKQNIAKSSSPIRYHSDMTQEEIRHLKDLLNTVMNTPKVVHTLRARSKQYGFEPMKLCGGIQGTWYLVDEKYDLYDPSNEIDPADVAYVRSLGFQI